MRPLRRVITTANKGTFNGQRMCQAVVSIPGQVKLMVVVVVLLLLVDLQTASPRLPVYIMLGARARARLWLHPSIRINIPALLRCGAKTRAIATRATMTHDEVYLLYCMCAY
jgi:hypothetical protein